MTAADRAALIIGISLMILGTVALALIYKSDDVAGIILAAML